MLKELTKAMDRSADYCYKELEAIKRSQSKLGSSIAKMKTELKTIDSKLNNAEELICDLQDRIMEITRSEQQTGRQMKKMKATYETYGII